MANGTCNGGYVLDVGATSATGNFSTDISNSATAGPSYGIPGCGGNIASGDTWTFQYWHRQKKAQNSNLSEAVTVTFL